MNPRFFPSLFLTAGIAALLKLSSSPLSLNISPTVLAGGILLLLAGLIGLFFKLSAKDQILILTLAIPFDFSAGPAFLPKLSLMDYLCTAALIPFICHPLRLLSDDAPRKALILWGVFLLYGLMLVSVTEGSIRPLLRWLEFLFAFMLAHGALRRASDRNSLATALVIASGFAATLALAQFFSAGADYGAARALFGQHNALAAFLALCAPAAAVRAFSEENPRRRFSMSMAAVLAGLTLGFTYSRGAFLGLTLGLLVLILQAQLPRWPQRRGIPLILMAMAVVLPLLWAQCIEFIRVPPYYPDNSEFRLFSTGARFHYWHGALAVLRQHPFIGMGPGNYLTEIPKLLPPDLLKMWELDLRYNHAVLFWQHMHNAYLQITVDYGSIGFVLWGLAFGCLIEPLFIPMKGGSRLRMAFRLSGLAFLFHNMVDVLFVSSFDLLFAFLLAAVYGEAPPPKDRIP